MVLGLRFPVPVAIDGGDDALNILAGGASHVKVYEAEDGHKVGGIIAYGGLAEAEACKVV
jgi:hypothetical protein